MNNCYQINSEDLKCLIEKRASFKKSRLFSPILFFGLNIILVVSLNLVLIQAVYLFCILAVLTTLVCLRLTNKAINKIEKIVTKIEFYEQEITLDHIGHSITIPIENVKLISTEISIVNKEMKGLSIDYNNTFSYLIFDYFNDEIEVLIEKVNSQKSITN